MARRGIAGACWQVLVCRLCERAHPTVALTCLCSVPFAACFCSVEVKAMEVKGNLREGRWKCRVTARRP